MSRTETYDRGRQDGSTVRITRDIDTGEQSHVVLGAESEPKVDAPADPKAADPKADGGQTPPADVERPSRGASLAAWVDFAKAVKFEHADGASRDEIRDAYEAAHPAE